MSIASYYADSDDNMKCTILVANWTSINVHIACQVIEHPRRCHVHTHTEQIPQYITSIWVPKHNPWTENLPPWEICKFSIALYLCLALIFFLCPNGLQILVYSSNPIPLLKYEGSRVLRIWNNKNKMHMCKQSNKFMASFNGITDMKLVPGIWMEAKSRKRSCASGH